MASKLGRTVLIVVEKFSELALIAETAKKMGVRPRIGIRVKLAAKGSGRWEASGGDRSKFGLSTREVVEAINFLRANDLLNCFELLHFHLGSQNLRHPRGQERAARGGAVLRRGLQAGRAAQVLRRGRRAGRRLRRVADQLRVVDELHDAGVRERHRVLAAGDLRRRRRRRTRPSSPSRGGRSSPTTRCWWSTSWASASSTSARRPTRSPATPPRVVKNLFETYKEVSRKNVLESYHDALEYKEEALQLFNLGNLSLTERVVAEDVFWAICQKLLKLMRELREVPEELEGLERALSDTYFCNFSMFQSLPDIWAIDQLFPIMPIHRLGEEPTRRAVLADITCDSDGKIDHFIDRRDVKDGAGAAPDQRPGLLPRHLPDRRVPGDPGRPAQPVRQHEHGARVAGGGRRLPDRARRHRRHRHRRAEVRQLLARGHWWRACAASPSWPCAPTA